MSGSEKLFYVLTISDSCYKGTNVDTSGPHIKELIEEEFGQEATIINKIIPDDKTIIESALLDAVNQDAAVIFTTGGTGFAPTDVTPEATRNVIERECPALVTAMFIESSKRTSFAALSRAVCGIRCNTLIINFPGSKKASSECFNAIKHVLSHAIALIQNDKKSVQDTHVPMHDEPGYRRSVHTCSHVLESLDPAARVSPYPMLEKDVALQKIYEEVKVDLSSGALTSFKSPVNIPPYLAAIKDGYAVKSTSCSGVKKVLTYIAAGSPFIQHKLKDDECFKINTGARMPAYADCVIPVENTKLVQSNEGIEYLVEILQNPVAMSDVRAVGCDLRKGENVFPTSDTSFVVINSLMASVGLKSFVKTPTVAIISSGDELQQPSENLPQSAADGKIFDSNSTMLTELLKYFGFNCQEVLVVLDDPNRIGPAIEDLSERVEFIISTGGVSMGDKDHIKPVLLELGYNIKFGRVNMKPGLPTTFATRNGTLFFGLPGNPVSAFVTFHLFVLPALRKASGYDCNKRELSTISVKIDNEKIDLDPRPEYARAQIISRNGELYAKITGDQRSSRLQSIVGADVLLHLPGRTENRKSVFRNDIIQASVLRYDFISKYE